MTRQPGLAAYENASGLPDLVAQAVQASRTVGFELACLPEVGRLLHVFAGMRRGIRIGESGTACGVGAAWIATAMDPGSTLVTVELDPERAAIASRLLASVPGVSVLQGDWSLLQAHGPFDLLFIDGGPAKTGCEIILSLLAPRGFVILDDLTPPEHWTPEQRREYSDGDPTRTAWRDQSGCSFAEVRVTEDAAVLVVVKLDEPPPSGR